MLRSPDNIPSAPSPAGGRGHGERALRFGFVLAALSALPSVAWAQQRAEYARPEDLRPEGVSNLLDVSMRVRYARVFSPARVRDLANIGAFSVRNRLLLGRTVSYCAGLDGDIGGSSTGVVYSLTAYALGVGARWGAGNAVSLCGGAGFDGVADAVPFAGRFPAELSVAQSVGPLRFTAWGSLAWTVGADARRRGSTSFDFADEFEAGLVVRLGRQRRYWSNVSAGGGPSIGAVYREFMGTRSVSVVIGLDLTGAR